LIKEVNQTDVLTGLPNIFAFRSIAQKILDSETERGKGLVFVHFDVKSFRTFNYLYGFDESERLLVHIGNVISETFPEFCVSRCFNDRFILLALNSEVEQRIKIVRNTVAAFKHNEEIILKAGVYIVPKVGEETSSHAQECAEIACDSIKDTEKVYIAYYNNELGNREKLRKHIIESIDATTESEHIKVYYQPIVHVVNRKICAYEGLARWEDPEFGFLSPGDFIDVLEDARLIHKLDVFVLRKICSQIRTAIDNNFPVVPVSVNLSALDFQVVNMPYLASEALRENNLPKEMLNIEITERALGKHRSEIYSVLEKFKSDGFEIWLDDFGSKYSSLNVLEEMDFDLLKIDSRFLQNFHTKPQSRLILKNVMNMTKEMGIRTLMEGVEDEKVLEFLKLTGCERAQGFLFGRPKPFEKFDRAEMVHENAAERKYYDAIGKVNLLSQMPLATGRKVRAEFENIEVENKNFKMQTKFLENKNVVLNSVTGGLPTAIAEFDGRRFKFLMSNKDFRRIFKNLGVGFKDSPDDVFNNLSLQFAMNIRSIAQQCIKTGEQFSSDFVTSEGFFSIRLRCIAYNSETKTGALLAVVDYTSKNYSLRREQRQDFALRFLYTLYNRIDLIKHDGTEMSNVYNCSPHYIETFVKNSVEQSVKNFAEKNIHAEDRNKFEQFLNLDTIDERLNSVAGNYITDFFRTRNENKNFTWQMYMLLPVIHQGEKYFLCCVRNIDSERMKRLPEINREGTEYFSMPGSPIFLLLASRSFTSVLGYGSFEKFLYNSFYLEADLTSDKILYMHLGKQGVIDDDSIYMSMNYGEVIREVVLNIAVEESQAEVEKFFDSQTLLQNYNQGKFFVETEFLRRSEKDSKPRWLRAVCQLRESAEVNEVHLFLLVFDIDGYRRTNEAMVNLIERDTLTGLYNRRTAINLIKDYFEKNNLLAFVILDLDNFKQINDRFGHDCGDKILKNASEEMKKYFGANGFVARLGGDEFLAVLKNISPEEVETLLKTFSEISKVIEYKGNKISYTMSIGYSLFPEQGKDYKELYQNADMALYAVKMAGRNSYKKFSWKMITENRAHLGVSLSQISEGMPGGFLLYRDNEQLEILYANSRLWKIYECESLEEFRKFTGNSFKGCVHPDDWNKVQKTIYEQIEISEGYDYVRYRVLTAKGNVKVIEDFGRWVHSTEDGDIFYVFIIDFNAKERLWDFVNN